VTYDQAWAICKAKMDKAGVPGTGLQANERYVRGANCMKSYGYKSSPAALSLLPATQMA
jgi:hypothetical protein